MASAHFNTNTRLLCEISDTYGLQQLITEPTRITESSSSLIDVIFTNCINRVVCSGVLHIGISDHSLIYVYRKLSPEFAFKGHSTKTYRNFSNFNRENFRRDISRQDWSCISDDPNTLWADWKAKFLSIVNSHAPIKTKRVRSGKVPWITSDLRKGMRDRDVAKRKAIKSNNPQDWAVYKRLRNRINGEVKSTKASYYAGAFVQSNGDSRKAWQLINELTSRQKNNASVKELKLNDNSVTNSHELSNAFNDHFSTIGTKLANEVPLVTDGSSYADYIVSSDNKFIFSPISSSNVFSLLNKLSKSKATGLDNISAKLIRECADLISIPLCNIFNNSLSSGLFPDDWKCARVTPLFKQGERTDINNYRPISVISIIAKVFERIVYDQLYSFLANEEIITNQQSGFRSLHSTVTALLEATDSWALDIDRGNVNAVVFLDLKKAFDTVDHGVLLGKLSLYGIQESAYDWFKSYLNNRTQKCVVNGSLSKVCSLGCGVPQGTILGPLLFLIYINDLPNCLSFCQPRMYADDTHITYASAHLHSMQSSLNRDLSNIHKWLLSNKLTLNSTKTEFMLIGSRQKLSTLSESLELSIDNIPIKQVSTAKSLGILIDNNMAWHSHIDKLSKKIASGIGAIKRIRPFVSPEILHYIYNALVQPHFDYCSIVWGNCGKTLSERLQKLQNRAARILTSSSYDADARFLLQQLGWKDLITQRQIQVALMVFKALNDLAPDHLSSMFTERSTSGYVLRDSTNKLNVPLPKTNYLKRSFSYRGATVWNSLPCNLRQEKSLNRFKQLLNFHFS